jgi:hypothetical protein
MPAYVPSKGDYIAVTFDPGEVWRRVEWAAGVAPAE